MNKRYVIPRKINQAMKKEIISTSSESEDSRSKKLDIFFSKAERFDWNLDAMDT